MLDSITDAIDKAARKFSSVGHYVADKLNQAVDWEAQRQFENLQKSQQRWQSVGSAIKKFSDWGNSVVQREPNDTLPQFLARNEPKVFKYATDYAKNYIAKPLEELSQATNNPTTPLQKILPYYLRPFTKPFSLLQLTPEMQAAQPVFSAYNAAKSALDKKNPIEGFVGNNETSLGDALHQKGLAKTATNIAEIPLTFMLAGVQTRKPGEFDVEEAFKKFKGENFDEAIVPYINDVLKWAQRRNIPEEIVYNGKVGEYLAQEAKNAKRVNDYVKKISLLSGLSEDEVRPLVKTGVEPIEIMKELRRQGKIRTEPTVNQDIVNRVNQIIEQQNAGKRNVTKIDDILKNYSPEKLAERMKGKSIEDLIDSEKAPKTYLDRIMENPTSYEEANFGGGKPPIEPPNVGSQGGVADFNSGGGKPPIEPPIEPPKVNDVNPQDDNFIKKLKNNFHKLIKGSKKIKSERDFGKFEEKFKLLNEALRQRVESKGVKFEDFVKSIESGNVPDNLKQEADYVKHYYDTLKDLASKRHGVDVNIRENYWHHTSSDMTKNWKPLTVGDVFTPGFAKKRTGKLEDYLKDPEAMTHYWRQSIGTIGEEERKTIKMARKMKKVYDKGKRVKLSEYLKENNLYSPNEVEYSTPKSVSSLRWVDNLGSRRNVDEKFYNDFLWKFKRVKINYNKVGNRLFRELEGLKKGTEEYDKKVSEIVKYLHDYRISEWKRSVGEFLDNAKKVHNPKLRKILDMMWDEYVGNEVKKQTTLDKVVNLITKRVAVGALGGNAKSALNNVYEIQRAYALVDPKYFKEALSDVAKGKDFTVKYGVDSSETIAEAFQHVKEVLGEEHKETRLDKLDNTLMYLFNKSEKLKDNIMLAAFEKQAKAKGLEGERAYQYVRDLFDQYAIKFGKGQTIGLYRNPISRLLLQFTQYSVKDSTILYDKIKAALEGNKGAQQYLKKIGLATIIRAGTNYMIFHQAMPGGQIGLSLFDNLSQFFDKDRKFYERIPTSPEAQFMFQVGDRYLSDNSDFKKKQLDKNIRRTALLAVPAGNQIYKTSDYLKNKTRGYYETTNGNVASPVGKGALNSLRGLLFGKSYDTARQKYIKDLLNNKKPYLNRYESEVYKKLPKEQRDQYYYSLKGGNGMTTNKKSLKELMSKKKITYSDTKELSKYMYAQLDNGIVPDEKLIRKIYLRSTDTNDIDNAYKKISYILKDPSYSDEQKAVFKKLLPDTDYYLLATKDESDRRQQFIKLLDQKDGLKVLATLRKRVGDKQALTNSDIDFLYDNGYISKSDKKLLKALKWDDKKGFYLKKSYGKGRSYYGNGLFYRKKSIKLAKPIDNLMIRSNNKVKLPTIMRLNAKEIR